MEFLTEDGLSVPAVTEEQMREVDRIAVEDFGLGILQMMENAGRNLALQVIEMLRGSSGEVTILAGSGGNGGGGLCCARHLHNHGYPVHVVLDRSVQALKGSAAHQYNILRAAGLEAVPVENAGEWIRKAQIVVDALIGYSLRGAPAGRVETLISLCNQAAVRVLSLDLPSGLNATTGERPGVAVKPERTMTLALPKTGLHSSGGQLTLADIGIPPEVYRPLGITFEPLFGGASWIPLAARISET